MVHELNHHLLYTASDLRRTLPTSEYRGIRIHNIDTKFIRNFDSFHRGTFRQNTDYTSFHFSQ
jgi:hypothetical protein